MRASRVAPPEFMDGSLTIGGLSAVVSASPGDIFGKLQFGATLLVKLRKGPWGGAVDGLYMDLEQDARRENVAATASARQAAVDVSIFRTLLPPWTYCSAHVSTYSTPGSRFPRPTRAQAAPMIGPVSAV